MILRALVPVLACLLVAIAPPVFAAKPGPLKDLKAQAEAGDVDAQAKLGEAYYMGRYRGQAVAKDPVQARIWLTRTADKDSTSAYLLARSLETENPAEAARLYRSVSERSSIRADYRLCVLYRTTPLKNWDEALIWCRSAAKDHGTRMYLEMAQAVEHGTEGQTASLSRAIEMYTELAGWRDTVAIRRLADYHFADDAQTGDAALSLKYTQLAAGLEPETYITRLARHYEIGRGVPVDLTEAGRLYLHAQRFVPDARKRETKAWLAAHPDITRRRLDALLVPQRELPDDDKKYSFRRPVVSPEQADLPFVPMQVMIGFYYPKASRADKVKGISLIECRVADTGDLINCMVASDTPEDYGFDRQSMLVLSRFGFYTPLRDELQPFAGRLIRLKFKWNWSTPPKPSIW